MVVVVVMRGIPPPLLSLTSLYPPLPSLLSLDAKDLIRFATTLTPRFFTGGQFF